FSGGSDGESAAGGAPAPGMGQSKSSRRRRRKRKKMSGAPAGENGSAEASAGESSAVTAPIVMEGESLALAASANTQPQRRPSFNGSSSGGSGGGSPQGQGQGKRWKKKFRDRERRPAQSQGNPGNEFRAEASGGSNGFHGNGGERQFNGGGDRGYERPYRRDGGRPDNFGNLVNHQGRKSKGQNGSKDRGFVGPMDHSYREVTSEFGEAPPSTIQMRGRRGGHRHFGDNQPIDYNAPRPVPIPEDAQTHIYLFIEDLFITAKVQETAKKLGVKVAFVKNEKEVIAELTSGEDQNKPSLIVFDLNNANAKPLTLIPKLKTKLKRSASIIGFLSSIQGDLKAKAVEAGCDTVMPRAAFSQNLPNLLRRYGVEEAEEVNYNY
ncbi:MAG TPA: hypothetical protein VKV02_11480, partial [Acidobacteriaceae bacterium]|nr:hypothetical protein [Acidobacteriaceae bacterium]